MTVEETLGSFLVFGFCTKTAQFALLQQGGRIYRVDGIPRTKRYLVASIAIRNERDGAQDLYHGETAESTRFAWLTTLEAPVAEVTPKFARLAFKSHHMILSSHGRAHLYVARYILPPPASRTLRPI